MGLPSLLLVLTPLLTSLAISQPEGEMHLCDSVSVEGTMVPETSFFNHHVM